MSVRLSRGELSSTAETSRRRQSEVGTVTIFSDLSLATALITPIVGDFQRLHPDLTIRVLSSYEPIEKTQEAFDIGLVYGRSEQSSYIVEPIADDAVFPVCFPSSPRALTYRSGQPTCSMPRCFMSPTPIRSGRTGQAFLLILVSMRL